MNTKSNKRSNDQETRADGVANDSNRASQAEPDSQSAYDAPELLAESEIPSADQPQDEVSRLKAALAEAEKRELLAVADLDNFRKRTRQATQEQLRYATLGIMNEILEALDNLQRAIESAENDPTGTGLLDGVKMVADQISSILESHGCTKIQSVGQPFDPNFHQAVKMEHSDKYPANTVIKELRSGFQLHDRVIRPVQVFVSTGAAE